jgi:hypothetical protein
MLSAIINHPFYGKITKEGVISYMAKQQEAGNEHYARHGGVHFHNNVPAEEINVFVRELPADKKDSLFEVMTELEHAGLITVVNDHVFTDGEGKLGGSNDC